MRSKTNRKQKNKKFIAAAALAMLMALFFVPSRSRAYFLPERPALGLPEVADFDVPAFTVPEESAPPASLSPAPVSDKNSAGAYETGESKAPLPDGLNQGNAPPADRGAPAAERSGSDSGGVLFLDNPRKGGIGKAISGATGNSGFFVNGYPIIRGNDVWDQPSQGGSSKQKTWALSDTESLFGNVNMNYRLPEGPVFGPEKRQYAFNAMGRFTTRSLAPVIIDAQAQSGYSYSNIDGNGAMPIGFMLDAKADNLDRKLSLQSTYNLNTVYSGFFYMAPVTHQLGQSLGYKLTPKLDFNSAVTYRVTECAHSAPQEVYQGGLAWHPAASNSVQGNLMLTNTAGGTGYEISAGFLHRLASTANLSINTNFRQDWMRLSHENFTLSWSWKWGRYLLSAVSTIGIDEYPFPEPSRLGRSVMLKVTRVFGIPFRGI